MTNKELFNQLSKKSQLDLVKALACYDEAHVEYYNGDYHIEINWSLLAQYPEDFKVLNTFKSEEFYPKGSNYFKDWYDFVDEKKSKGEKNSEGQWQKEFEKVYESIFQQAINYFKQVNA